MAETKITKNELADRSVKGEWIKIYKNTTQSIPATTATKLTFQASTGNDSTLMELKTNGVKILSSKIKSVMCSVFCQINATHVFMLYVYKNSTQIAALATPAFDSHQLANVPVEVSANDIISFYIYDATGTSTVTSASDWNFAVVNVLTTNE